MLLYRELRRRNKISEVKVTAAETRLGGYHCLLFLRERLKIAIPRLHNAVLASPERKGVG